VPPSLAPLLVFTAGRWIFHFPVDLGRKGSSRAPHTDVHPLRTVPAATTPIDWALVALANVSTRA